MKKIKGTRKQKRKKSFLSPPCLHCSHHPLIPSSSCPPFSSPLKMLSRRSQPSPAPNPRLTLTLCGHRCPGISASLSPHPTRVYLVPTPCAALHAGEVGTNKCETWPLTELQGRSVLLKVLYYVAQILFPVRDGGLGWKQSG